MKNLIHLKKSILFKSISFLLFFIALFLSSNTFAQETRLLRQPTMHENQIAFAYGGDIWTTNLSTNITKRLTSTPAMESTPHFSPDGKWIAFTSNRSGSLAVYVVSVNGGEATRLTWHTSPDVASGWTNDGKHVLFASTRDTAPSSFDRLYTVSVDGGPATKIMEQWATSGSYSPNGKQLVIDRMRRWDIEWRDYRGGQNTPLIIVDLKTLDEADASKNKPFEKFVVEDLGPQGSSAAYFVMNKELQETLIQDDLVGICSDGSKTGFHPRGHGTFAKVIENYVVQDSLISLEKAVQKMTSYAAEILQLKDRGVLQVGKKADILIFDPKNVKATATYVNPHQLAQGFDMVLVNGKVTRENQQLKKVLSGKVLLPN